MATTTEVIEAFVLQHDPCGELEGTSTPATVEGYRLVLTCSCGAVLDGELEPEKALFAQAAPQLARDASRFFPRAGVRRDLLLDEGADRSPQYLVLVRERRARHGGRIIARRSSPISRSLATC